MQQPPNDPTQPSTSAPQPAADDQAGAAPAPVVMNTQQVGKYKIEVINNKCIGAASCVAIAPGTFKLNEQNIAEIISQTGDDPDTQLLAAQSCPTAAIIITDTETGQQVWPIE